MILRILFLSLGEEDPGELSSSYKEGVGIDANAELIRRLTHAGGMPSQAGARIMSKMKKIQTLRETVPFSSLYTPLLSVVLIY